MCKIHSPQNTTYKKMIEQHEPIKKLVVTSGALEEKTDANRIDLELQIQTR